MATININDATFYYELHGKGQPLILIAGYTCNHQFWLSILEQLSQHFKVLILDNRGVGRTVDKGKPLSVQSMANDVMALAQALDLHQPHIVGQSMGGTIAQSIASEHASHISKLVLLNTVAKWRQAMLRGLKSHLLLREQEVAVETLFEAVMPWVFGDAFLSNEAQVEVFKQAALNDLYPQSLEDQYRQFKALATFDGRKQLKNIKTPTLVGYGNEDIISLPQESKYLVDHIADAKYVEFNCAHALPVELPQQLAEVLIRYLKN